LEALGASTVPYTNLDQAADTQKMRDGRGHVHRHRGEKKIEVLKEVRALTGLGSKGRQGYVEGAPRRSQGEGVEPKGGGGGRRGEASRLS